MPEVTRRIQQYEVLGRIGRGGMSTVYLAFDPDLERQVALKELDLRDTDSDLVERFMRESRMAASLGHQNIITVFSRMEEDGIPYIAMEYLDQGSLRPHVNQLSGPQIYGVLEGTLAGLAHAHGKQLVHRDLKPENLLITSEGTVKIADFGIAKALSSATRGLTRRSGLLGTPCYMAPEQVSNKPVGPPTDLYALGVIAFELFCGRVPFEEGDEPMAVLFRHVSEAPPTALSLRPDLDPRLSEWIGGLLAKDPADRPQQAEDAWEELEDIVVSLDGATWRRQARLTPVPGQEERATPKPLTPAPFDEPPSPEQKAPEPEPAKAEPPPKPEPPKSERTKPQPPRPPAKTAPPRPPELEAKPAPAGAPSTATDRLARVAAFVAVVAGLALVGASFMDYFLGDTLWEAWVRADAVVTTLAAALAGVGIGALVSRKPMVYMLAAALAALLWGWWSVTGFFEGAGLGAKVGSAVTLIAVVATTVAMLRLLPAPRDGALVGRAPLIVVLGSAILSIAAMFVDYTEGGGSFWEGDESGLWLGPLVAAAVAAGVILVFLRRWSAHAALLLGAFVAGNGLIVVELLFDLELGAAGYWLMLGSVVVGAAGAVAGFLQTRRLSALR